MRAALATTLSLLAMALSGCGSSAPHPATPDTSAASEPATSASTKTSTASGASAKPSKSAPAVSQEVGSLDKQAVEQQFGALTKRAEKCQEDRRKQVEKLDFLAGQIEVEIRVLEDGQIKSVLAPRSSVGDRIVEKCILDAARTLSWPKPEGGREGIAKSTLSLPMRGDRDAVAWDAAKAASAVSKAKAAVGKCRGDKSFSVEATAYVDTDGKVIAAGLSLPDAAQAESADCIADALRAMSFASPGGWPAKVSFSIN